MGQVETRKQGDVSTMFHEESKEWVMTLLSITHADNYALPKIATLIAQIQKGECIHNHKQY